MSDTGDSLLNEPFQEANRPMAEALARVLHASNGPMRTAFATRALNLVAGLSASLSEDSLSEATSAPSDYEAMIRALAEPGAQDTLLRPRSPEEETERLLARARLRGLQEREWILRAEGGVLGVSEVAAHLHVSRQAVEKRRRSGTLIGLQVGRRGYMYPAWQFERDGTLPGLEEVLSALDTQSPWMRAAFMLNPNTRLDDESPLSALRRGEVAEARRAAESYGEHGAA